MQLVGHPLYKGFFLLSLIQYISSDKVTLILRLLRTKSYIVCG